MRCVATLYLLSIAVYAVFEVVKMVLTLWHGHTLYKAYETSKPQADVSKMIDSIKADIRQKNRWIFAVWPWAFVFSAVTGFGSGGILIYFLWNSL